MIITGDGKPDEIHVQTDLPTASPKYSNLPLSFGTNAVEAGTAEEYCRKHFPGVPMEVIRLANNLSW